MPYIQAQSYMATSRRVQGSADPQNSVRIIPVPFVGAGNNTEYVDITYNGAPTVGQIPPQQPVRVFGYFEPWQFEIHYQLLQQEAPIEIEWSLLPGSPDQLMQLIVRTREEPPGEGPTDKT